MNYGKELILDLHDCDVNRFNRKDIEKYFIDLCELIDMEREDLHFWDDEDVPEELKQKSPETKGTSAIQFIITSNITIHALDLLGKVFINVFSCKEFNSYDVEIFTQYYFNGNIVNSITIDRM